MNGALSSPVFDRLPYGYRIDRHLGVVYDETPSGADDLTLIRGISTRECVVLNQLGIYYIAQIALWKHHEIGVIASELGVSAARLSGERWVEQAHAVCHPRPALQPKHPLPASFSRTVALLICALFIGCFTVFWLRWNTTGPMNGVLSADSTSLRVPADALLIETHVQPGDIVRSGDKLMTLEKTSHLALIESEKLRANELAQQLKQAEAQAELDLAWRTREVERELSDVRAKAHLIQEVQRTSEEPVRSAMTLPLMRRPGRVSTISASAILSSGHRTNPGSLLFFSGASDSSTVDAESTVTIYQPLPTRSQSVSSSATAARSAESLNVEARTIAQRLRKLEELKSTLPMQVRQAAGVDNIRFLYEEVSRRVSEMTLLDRQVSVICPGYGTISHIQFRDGESMRSGDTMLKILHTQRRFILVNVPTQRVNEVHPGDVVELIFPGGEQFKGTLANVPMLAETILDDGTTIASVRVEQVGRLWPQIPIGSQIAVLMQ